MTWSHAWQGNVTVHGVTSRSGYDLMIWTIYDCYAKVMSVLSSRHPLAEKQPLTVDSREPVFWSQDP